MTVIGLWDAVTNGYVDHISGSVKVAMMNAVFGPYAGLLDSPATVNMTSMGGFAAGVFGGAGGPGRVAKATTAGAEGESEAIWDLKWKERGLKAEQLLKRSWGLKETCRQGSQ